MPAGDSCAAKTGVAIARTRFGTPKRPGALGRYVTLSEVGYCSF
jgi:hypothetical protein